MQLVGPIIKIAFIEISSFSFQELHARMEAELAPADPLDVDNKQISENLTNASQQPSTPYGSIPNGTTNGEGTDWFISWKSLCLSPLFLRNITVEEVAKRKSGFS